jgi:hypothetical protein
MPQWFWFWLAFVVLVCIAPLAWGWGLRGWGPPPGPWSKEATPEALRPTADGRAEGWGSLGPLIWIAWGAAVVWVVLALI